MGRVIQKNKNEENSMEKQGYRIWNDMAIVEASKAFAVATVGERRKVYGALKNLPEFMLIDREKRVFISAVNTEDEDKEKDTVELAQTLNHTLTRTVPGYKCMGIYRRQIAQREVCVVQYTSYLLEDNIYTMLLVAKEGGQVCMLNCVCGNEQVPQMHPVFLEIIESLKFKE